MPISITDELVAMRDGVTTRLRTAANHLMSRQENSDLYDATQQSFISNLNAP